jgi:biopolymer transport protein ExbD
LIIFLIVAPMIVNTAAVQPPFATNLRAHPEENRDHTLAIDREGRYFLDRAPINAASLGARLDSLYAGRDDHVLFVRADRTLDYAKVLNALRVAGRSGVRMVGMIAEAPPRR